MAFWERNFIFIGIATLLTALAYFGIVAWQSYSLGHIAPPSLLLFLASLMAQVFGSTLIIWLWHMITRSKPQNEESLPHEGMDERDRFVKLKSEASSAHFYSLFFFMALLGWFAHENAAILFHSLIAAFFLGDIARSLFQILYYNKAY